MFTLRFHGVITVLIAMSALAGCFLFIADLGERFHFDRLALELALLAPLAIWLLQRRIRHS